MIAENIQNIRENVSKACFRVGRDPQSIEMIAVSKTFDAHQIVEASEFGLVDFGENYIQELVNKKKSLFDKNIRWHFIGHLQSNKVKYIAEWIHLIQSVDTIGLAEEIQKRAERAKREIDILIEVNTSEEATKFGVKPTEAIDLIKNVIGFPNIKLKGLMTIGPFSEIKDESRNAFRVLKKIFDEANESGILSERLTILSMGMTHDFDVAIEEGSTMIRIGTAIFGSRN